MNLALVSLLLVIAAVLLVRAARREKRDYRRFKRLTSTRKRQRVFARWLRDAFFLFGGLIVVVLLAAWQYVPLVLNDTREWAPVAGLTGLFEGGIGVGFGIGAGIVVVALLLVPVILLRSRVDEVPALGDIGALLPRTRGELVYGAALALNAGVLEELLFRLAMPALLFGITGNGPLSFLIAALLFGLLHLYQGLPGVAGSTVLGLLFTVVYVLSGSIAVPIVLHALIDLRSLVLIPVVIQKVHRVEA
ncbi:CPBP family intramembrane glutamic endopeptidase [Galbitalea soli]|uniref:CPBP family intramembrane metalloprotease n=1 Tax=Galbitalea soli TaxID=1268042 RepID=A0A7C9PMF7_9MICO|nr:CPBP family intramembrane glutamic endopeptidase [Galbitalea soli]NEM90708.1 CPBP family intramembrane metalloprotease [Galbitalea soli]NYJ31426.1 membrane protease YdiL (CAAX protease family) [Galbitalea soli]